VWSKIHFVRRSGLKSGQSTTAEVRLIGWCRDRPRVHALWSVPNRPFLPTACGRGRTPTLGRNDHFLLGCEGASPQGQRDRLPEKVARNLREVLFKFQVRLACRTPCQPPMAPSPRCNGVAAWQTPRRRWAYVFSAVGMGALQHALPGTRGGVLVER